GYTLDLLGYDGESSRTDLLVGLVMVTEKQTSKGPWMAQWQSTEFFVPRSMYGGGIVDRLLDALVKRYKKDSQKFDQLRVRFAPQTPDQKEAAKPKVISQAERQQRVQDIEFYKSRGFEYVEQEISETGKIDLVLRLNSNNKS